jgi:hypothetical protein
MGTSASLKTLLKDLEPNELREVITELCKLSPKNRQFVELFLQGSDAANIESIVNEARKKIRLCFFNRNGEFQETTELGKARRIISEYAKLLKDYPKAVTGLKLYYVEAGTELTNIYGDMYESFYNSLSSMFKSFCKDVMKHPSWYDDFAGGIHIIRRMAEPTGWGYYEEILEYSAELEQAVKN